MSAQLQEAFLSKVQERRDANTKADELQILDLLSRGMPQAQIAEIVGCTPGWISQLKQRGDFAQKLLEKRAAFMEEGESRQERVRRIHDGYLEIEERLVGKIKQELDWMKPGEKLKLLQIVGAKKEPATPLENLRAKEVPVVVNISLPASILPQFQLSPQREIIGMDGGQMFTPMNTTDLKNLAMKELIRQNAQAATDATEKPVLPSNKSILGMFEAAHPDEEIQI